MFILRCTIQIGPWQMDTKRLKFNSDQIESMVDTSKYVPHPIWNLEKIEVITKSHSERFPKFGKNYTSQDLYFDITVRRGSLYYMTTFIPCFILNVATLIAFFVNNSIVVQVNLCKLILFNFFVLHKLLSNLLPIHTWYLLAQF
jgi:hypothetical protein